MRPPKFTLLLLILLIVLAFGAIVLFFVDRNQDEIVVTSDYSSHQVDVINEDLLDTFLREMRILGQNGIESVSIKLSSSNPNKNVFLGAGNNVIAAGDYAVKGNTLDVQIYISEQALQEFPDNANGLFNQQFVSTLLTLEEVSKAFISINLDDVDGPTIQDKRLNYILQKYFSAQPLAIRKT